MRRLVLMLVIMIAIIQFMPASVEMGTSGGTVSAKLLLEMKDVTKLDFGLSSNPVDDRNLPTPISSVTLTGSLVSENEMLTGSGSTHAYWDIAAIDPVRISVKIPSEMKGDIHQKNLDWCCYCDIDGKRYYIGYIGDSGYTDSLVEPLHPSSQNDFKSYGGSFVIYEDNTGSYSYARTDSAQLHFRTGNAYPSDIVQADRYSGQVVLSLEVLE